MTRCTGKSVWAKENGTRHMDVVKCLLTRHQTPGENETSAEPVSPYGHSAQLRRHFFCDQEFHSVPSSLSLA